MNYLSNVWRHGTGTRAALILGNRGRSCIVKYIDYRRGDCDGSIPIPIPLPLPIIQTAHDYQLISRLRRSVLDILSP